MKRRIVTMPWVVSLLLSLFLIILLLPCASLARDAVPEIYYSHAIPEVINLGTQPQGNPLVLRVKIGTGGEINSVSANLNDPSGAKYYDPLSDTICDASVVTPLRRVYKIDGDQAYLFEAGSRYEYNEYRTAFTHKILRGTAAITNTWQVEIPDAGHTASEFSLRVTATDRFGHQSHTSMFLKIVDDCTAPQLSAGIDYTINSLLTRAGDKVTIKAIITDDLSGVFSARLNEDSAEAIFGEAPNLEMTRQFNSDVWKVENTIAPNVTPGTYSLEIVATDRAGNETVHAVEIEVAKEISSLKIDLSKGWNLISVPRALKNPAISDVFANVPVESVQTVMESKRIEASQIEPGRGYLVKTTEATTLVVNFADHDPSAIPLTLDMGPGWNLIGYASESLEPMMPLTYYLGDDLKDKWMIVYTDNGAQARTQSTSPYVWATDSFPTITGEPYSEDSDNLPAMELGKGYWIYLTSEGILVP